MRSVTDECLSSCSNFPKRPSSYKFDSDKTVLSEIEQLRAKISKGESLVLPLKCSISDKTGLSETNSYDEGLSGKFEQLDKQSYVTDLIENVLYKDFNSIILFKSKPLFA